jgi:N-acetylglutamate synthase-like GNAT family acetyltransferase
VSRAAAVTVSIRPARPGEEALLTELAVRSKGHWGHDAAFLERARTGFTVRPEHLERWFVRVAERDGAAVGVAAVDPPAGELELLFVEPAAIGTGVGRALLRDALARAREAGLAELVIESDLDAEPFYRAHGAEPVGTRIVAATGRELPLLLARSAPAPGRRERHGERREHAGEQQEPAGVAPERRVTGDRVEHDRDRERDDDAERQRPGLAEHELAQRAHQAGASAACRDATAPTCAREASTSASAR